MTATHRTFAIATLFAIAGCDATGPTGGDLAFDRSFCPNAPQWFAFSADGSTWTVVTPDANGRVTYQAPRKHVWAFVNVSDGRATTTVVFQDQDLVAVGNDACPELSGTATLSGTIDGIAGADGAVVSAGLASTTLFTAGGYAFATLPDHPVDLVATRFLLGDESAVPDRVVVRRGVPVGDVAPPVDLSGVESRAIATVPVTLTGASDGQFVTIESVLGTANKTFHRIAHEAIAGTAATAYLIPAELIIDGDWQAVAASVAEDNGGRYVERRIAQPAALTLALGPSIGAVLTALVDGASMPRPRVELAAPSAYSYLSAAFVSADASNTVTLEADRAYFGAAGTWALVAPDFSTAPGYNPDWQLKAGDVLTAVSVSSTTPGSGQAEIARVVTGAYRYGTIP